MKTFEITEQSAKEMMWALRSECGAILEDVKDILILDADNQEQYDIYDKIKVESFGANGNYLACYLDLPDSDWSKAGEYDIRILACKGSESWVKQLAALVMYNFLLYFKKLPNASILRIVDKSNHDINIEEFEIFMNDFYIEYIKSCEIANEERLREY